MGKRPRAYATTVSVMRCKDDRSAITIILTGNRIKARAMITPRIAYDIAADLRAFADDLTKKVISENSDV